MQSTALIVAEARAARLAEALKKAADRFEMLKVNCRDIPASLDAVLFDGAHEARTALSATDAQITRTENSLMTAARLARLKGETK